MLLELEHRHGDDDRDEHRSDDGQRKCVVETPAKLDAQKPGNIGTNSEKRRLGQGHRTGMTEYELETDNQKRIAPGNCHDIVGIGVAVGQCVAGECKTRDKQRHIDA